MWPPGLWPLRSAAQQWGERLCVCRAGLLRAAPRLLRATICAWACCQCCLGRPSQPCRRHYLSDVLAGLLLGFVTVGIVTRVRGAANRSCRELAVQVGKEDCTHSGGMSPLHRRRVYLARCGNHPCAAGPPCCRALLAPRAWPCPSSRARRRTRQQRGRGALLRRPRAPDGGLAAALCRDSFPCDAEISSVTSTLLVERVGSGKVVMQEPHPSSRGPTWM